MIKVRICRFRVDLKNIKIHCYVVLNFKNMIWEVKYFKKIKNDIFKIMKF